MTPEYDYSFDKNIVIHLSNSREDLKIKILTMSCEFPKEYSSLSESEKKEIIDKIEKEQKIETIYNVSSGWKNKTYRNEYTKEIFPELNKNKYIFADITSIDICLELVYLYE
jgi:hypothetical protein